MAEGQVICGTDCLQCLFRLHQQGEHGEQVPPIREYHLVGLILCHSLWSIDKHPLGDPREGPQQCWSFIRHQRLGCSLRANRSSEPIWLIGLFV